MQSGISISVSLEQLLQKDGVVVCSSAGVTVREDLRASWRAADSSERDADNGCHSHAYR